MLRNSLVLAFALFLLSFTVHSQSNGTPKKIKSIQPFPPVTLVAPEQGASDKAVDDHERHIYGEVRIMSTPPRDKYDKAAVWINGVLGFVGVIGILVATGSLIFIRKQTGEMKLQRETMQDTLNAIQRQAGLMETQAKHMETQTGILSESVEVARDGAKAALLNAQAVLDAERAWILVSHDGHAGLTNGFAFNFTGRNCGKTPAEVVYAVLLRAYLDNGQELPERPSYELDFSEWSQRRWIAPNESAVVENYDTSSIPPEIRDHVDSGRKILWLYGVVRYRDTMSNAIHETRFCYRRAPTPNIRLIMAGPPAYNEARDANPIAQSRR